MIKNILLLFLLNSIFIYSQNDCSDALIVCGNSGYQDLTVTSVGTQELSGSYSGSFAGDGSQLTNLPFSSQLISGSAVPGALENNFVREIDVIADDSYFIIIDRPEGTSNFKIEWTGTGTFNDPPSATPPTRGEFYDLLLWDSNGVKDNRTTFNLTSNENLFTKENNVKVIKKT